MWPMFWAYKNQSIKGSEVQKQRPHKLLWMLWFDEKSIPILCSLKDTATAAG